MRHDRRFSLLEVTIAVSLLGVLMLAGASMMVTLQRGTALTAALIDLDQSARRVVGQLRSELRQSGFHQDDVAGAKMNFLMVTGTLKANTPAAGQTQVLECFLRTFIVTGTLGTTMTGDGAVNSTGRPQGTVVRDVSWGRAIRYRLIPSRTIPAPTGPLQLYTLVQDIWIDKPEAPYAVGDGLAQANELILGLPVCEGVREMTVTQRGASVEVVMTLAKTNPDWTDLVNGAPEPLGVQVRERVQMQNAANGEWTTGNTVNLQPTPNPPVWAP